MEALLVVLLLFLFFGILFLFYKSTLHWIWDLGILLLFLLLVAALNRHSIQNPAVWECMAMITIGYLLLLILIGSVESIRNVDRLKTIEMSLTRLEAGLKSGSFIGGTAPLVGGAATQGPTAQPDSPSIAPVSRRV